MDDLIGKVVAGRYRVLGELGRGGMGVVYRVEHTRTGEQLALKVLTGAARFDAQSLARFRREARASAKVDSPYVVRVMDADDAPELGGTPFLVMELLKGEDLERRVVEHGPLAPADLVPILAQVGSAVERAHRVGVVHRDLKPENLFLHEGSDGRRIAKVLDFGISRFVSEAALAASASATATGSLVGTPLFMAPEQATGDHTKIGPATDIWALGLVALRLLTAEHYWGSGTIAEVVTKIMVGAMPAPSGRWPESEVLSPALDVWFARSCDRDPSARFASVEEQMTALAQALGIDASKEWSGTELPASSSPPASDPALAPTEFDARTETPLAAVASASQPRPRRRFVALVAATALTATSGTLACPIFESSGTKQAGWFGATAAEYACRVGTDMLGGRPEPVKVPAELLALPRTPTPDFPTDPFEEPNARGRSLAAAKHADADHVTIGPGWIAWSKYSTVRARRR